MFQKADMINGTLHLKFKVCQLDKLELWKEWGKPDKVGLFEFSVHK